MVSQRTWRLTRRWVASACATGDRSRGVRQHLRRLRELLRRSRRDGRRGRNFDAFSPAALAASPPCYSENMEPALRRRSRRPRPNHSPQRRAVHGDRRDAADFVGNGWRCRPFWLPISLAPLVHGDDTWLAIGRHRAGDVRALGPGGTADQARAEATTIANRLRSLHIRDPSGHNRRPSSAGADRPSRSRWRSPCLTLTIVRSCGRNDGLTGRVPTSPACNWRRREPGRTSSNATGTGGKSRRVVRQLLTEARSLACSRRSRPDRHVGPAQWTARQSGRLAHRIRHARLRRDSGPRGLRVRGRSLGAPACVWPPAGHRRSRATLHASARSSTA